MPDTDQHPLIAKWLNRLSVDELKKRTDQGIFDIYLKSRIWENSQKQHIYRQLLETDSEKSVRLSVHEMEACLPCDVIDKVSLILKKRRSVLLQNGVFEQLGRDATCHIKRLIDEIPDNVSPANCFEYALNEYLQQQVALIVPEDMCDRAANYVHFKLEQRAYDFATDQKWNQNEIQDIPHKTLKEVPEKDQTVRKKQQPLCQKLICVARCFFSRQRD